MRALKGVLVYIGIVLGVAVGLGLILVCIMYFVPSFRIAGIGMIHFNKKGTEEVVSLESYTGYEDIVINANSDEIGIYVIPTEGNEISYNLNLSIFGLSTEIVEYQVVQHVEVNDGTLQIYFTVTEPKGWISTNDSALVINVPTSMKFGLVANTESGLVTIGSEKLSTNLSDLSVSTNNGDLKLINIGAGETEKSLTLETLNLSTHNGEFDLSSIESLTVLNKVKLYAENGKFVFKNVYASIDITGTGVDLLASKITCGTGGFSFIADSGYFEFDLLSCDASAENTIIAENIALNVKEISGKTGIVTSYGNLNINKLNGYTIIENEHGNVSVGVARDTIIIKTNMGSINVNEYYATGKFSSNRGDINVYSCGDFNEEYYTEISNVDGNVKVKNHINRLIVTTSGRSNVVVVFGKVKTDSVFQHKINTNTNASCVVYMPTVGVAPYRFIAKGIISGEIGGKVSASETEQIYPSSSTENKAAALKNCSFAFIGKIEFKAHSLDNIANVEI